MLRYIARYATWVCFSLMVSLYTNCKADQPGLIPDDATDLLRHDKHALIYFPVGNNWLEDGYLITRKKTYHKDLSIRNHAESWINQLRFYCNGSIELPLDSVFTLCRKGYTQLIGIFEKELEEIYQITIVSESPLLMDIPFGALIRYNISQNEAPKFLNEFWAVSYLYNFDFQRIEDRPSPDKILWDSSNAYISTYPPNEGVHLFHRWPQRSSALPPGKASRFDELIGEGFYTDEALGLARTEYLESVRRRIGSDESNARMGLDPRIWASTIVYGEIAPLNPPFSFPWWILVPIGLVLVIAFGKRL